MRLGKRKGCGGSWGRKPTCSECFALGHDRDEAYEKRDGRKGSLMRSQIGSIWGNYEHMVDGTGFERQQSAS